MRYHRSVTLSLGVGLVALVAVMLARADWAQAEAIVGAPPAPAQGKPAADLSAILASAGRSADNAQPPSAYMLVTDESEFTSMEVPAAWRDYDTGPWIVNGTVIGVFVSAAPDLEAFEAETGPGVFFGLTKEGIPTEPTIEEPAAAVEAIAGRRLGQDSQRFNACLQDVKSYDDPHLHGTYNVVSDCQSDRGQAQRVLLDAMPLSQTYRVALRAVTVSPQDRAAVAHILRTFQVVHPSMINPHSDAEENASSAP